VLAEIAIRNHEPCGDAAEWHKPFRIRKPEARRTRPDLFLVPKKILRQATEAPMKSRRI